MSAHVWKYTLVLVCLLSATLLAAQTAATSHLGRGIVFARYNPANELALNGTIRQVVTTHNFTSPPGMHLLIAGPRGTADVHLGPFLAKDVQAGLHPGASVKVVGAMEELHGQQYLLARLLELNGRVVNVRNSKGFLLRPLSTGAAHVAARNSAQNGGRR